VALRPGSTYSEGGGQALGTGQEGIRIKVRERRQRLGQARGLSCQAEQAGFYPIGDRKPLKDS
jgi:hypothetical protein